MLHLVGWAMPTLLHLKFCINNESLIIVISEGMFPSKAKIISLSFNLLELALFLDFTEKAVILLIFSSISLSIPIWSNYLYL